MLRDRTGDQRLHAAPGILFFETQKGGKTLQMANFSYRTIAKPAEGSYKEKGSRFLAFAYPVSAESDIKAHISQLEKKYFDARHHCFAWMLGVDKQSFRAFDDGEPNHSGGDPILGQIRSKDLTNVLVVVVRYFGGVKLGVGGLITAYRTAAEDALNRADIIEKEVTERIRVAYDYAATPEVMRLVKEFDLDIQSQNFQDDCSLTAEYKLKDRERFIEKLELMKAMGVKVRFQNDTM
jgi:uncharacterized YigZ family protein